MIGAVPLLPHKGFEKAVYYLNKSLPNGGQSTSSAYKLFIAYIRSQYTNKNISVFGCPDRTNNYCEQFHAKLRQQCGVNIIIIILNSSIYYQIYYGKIYLRPTNEQFYYTTI